MSEYYDTPSEVEKRTKIQLDLALREWSCARNLQVANMVHELPFALGMRF